MHFSRPSGQRLSWWRPWKRGAVGTFSNGYYSVTTLRNIVRKVTPNPATGSQAASFMSLRNPISALTSHGHVTRGRGGRRRRDGVPTGEGVERLVLGLD